MPNFLSPITREIAMLRESLKAVDCSLRRLGPKLHRALNRRNGAEAGPRTWKFRLSPKRLAQLKLQGQYIGYMRNLKAKQKAEVTRLRERVGVRAAISRAKSLIGNKAAKEYA
jgi:hypothetical protein